MPRADPTFTYYEEPGNDSSHGLLVRAAFLRDFPAAHKLELVVLRRFQRMELSDRYDGKHPPVQSLTEGRVAADLAASPDVPSTI
jgi:hypothetical protein